MRPAHNACGVIFEVVYFQYLYFLQDLYTYMARSGPNSVIVFICDRVVHQLPLDVGLWRYLKSEVTGGYVVEEEEETTRSERQKRMDTFIQAPKQLEKVKM